MSSSPVSTSPRRNETGVVPAVTSEKVEIEEPEVLKNSLAYIAKRTVVRCDAVLMQHLGAGISPARFSALACVGSNLGMSQAALGALLGIAGPSVVKVVDGLENLGLLRRTPGPDRRVSALQLTDTGRRKLKQYSAAVKLCEENIAAGLTSEERHQLISLLKKVALADT